jgi:tetratricopeptide (TPR) repeat protein
MTKAIQTKACEGAAMSNDQYHLLWCSAVIGLSIAMLSAPQALAVEGVCVMGSDGSPCDDGGIIIRPDPPEDPAAAARRRARAAAAAREQRELQDKAYALNQQAIKEVDFERKIALFEKAVETWSDPVYRGNLYSTIAELHASKGDWREAESFMARAIHDNPDSPSIKYRRARQAYLQQKADEEYGQWVEKSEKRAQESLKIRREREQAGDRSNLLDRQAMQAQHEGNFAKAIALMEEALRVYPDSIDGRLPTREDKKVNDARRENLHNHGDHPGGQ